MGRKNNIQEIIIGCLKKQSKYQRALVDQYSGLLYVICKRYLNDDEFARDMVQESLVKIFRNLEKFDGRKAGFETWITTITVRLCLSKLSRKKLSIVSMQDYNVVEMEDDKSKYILDQMETDYLVEMIKELPDGYREVFNMAAIDGFSHVEIATHLKITADVSRVRLSRAKNMLRKKINNLNNQELWVNSN